jgi:hypothetical protein
LEKRFIKDGSTMDDAPDFDGLSSLPGRCTSFAIQVVEWAQRMHRDEVDFQIFKLGGHRLARCQAKKKLASWLIQVRRMALSFWVKENGKP